MARGGRAAKKNAPPLRDVRAALFCACISFNPHPCPLSKQTRQPPTLACAHGGDRAAAPPNTVAAISAAVSAGAPCIEVDASSAADGRLIALHERDLAALLLARGGAPNNGSSSSSSSSNSSSDSSSDGSGASTAPHHPQPQPRIADWASADLLALRWPRRSHSQSHRPALLKDALAAALAAPSAVELVIVDFKDGGVDNVPELLRVVGDSGCGRRCLVWGKSDAAMAAVAAVGSVAAGYTVMAPPTECGSSSGGDGESTLATKGQQPYAPLRLPGMAAAGVWHGMVDGALLAKLRRAGQRLIAWTLDDPSELARLLDLGACFLCLSTAIEFFQQGVRMKTPHLSGPSPLQTQKQNRRRRRRRQRPAARACRRQVPRRGVHAPEALVLMVPRPQHRCSTAAARW
jgi:glycerophosphoryl diester phosphodiesterase